MKKLFAILMSIMMIACFMPSMAFAAEIGNINLSATCDGETVENADENGYAFTDEVGYSTPKALNVTVTKEEGAGTNSIIVDLSDQKKDAESAGEGTEYFKIGDLTESKALNFPSEGETNKATFTVTPVERLGAGEYTATVTLKQGENTTSFKVRFTVTKKTLTADNFTFKAPTGLTYDGKGKTATVTAENLTGEVGDFSVKYFAKNAEEALAGEPTNAGEYTVKIDAKGNDTYAADPALTGTNWKFAITQADPKAEHFEFTTQNFTYNGNEQKVEPTFKDKEFSESGAITYSYEKVVESGENVATANPTDVGTYKVTAHVAGGKNFNKGDVSSEDWTFTIGKATGHYTAPTVLGTTLKYNGEPQPLINPGSVNEDCTCTMKYRIGDTGEFSTAIPKETAAGTYAVYYMVTGDENHEEVSATKLADVTIAQKEITVNAGTYKVSKVYDGDTDVKEGNVSGELACEGILPADAQKVTVTATPTSYGSEDAGEGQLNVNIALSGEKANTDNYKILNDATTIAVPTEISKKEITLDKDSVKITEKVYDGSDEATVESLAFIGLVNDENLNLTNDCTIHAYFDNEDAADNKHVTVEVKLKENGDVAKNYVLDGDAIDAKGNIKRATKNPAPTAEVTVQKGTYGFVDIHEKIETDGATGEISVSEGKDTYFDAGKKPRVNPKNLLEFTLSGTASDTVVITVPVENARNYENYNITVTVTVSDAEQVNVAAPRALDRAYDGTKKPLVEAGVTSVGTMQYSLEESNGYTEAIPEAKDANDSYTVYYKVVKNEADVSNAKGSVTVKIEKAPVTVQPKSFTIKQGDGLPTLVLEYVGLLGEDKLTVEKDYQPAFKYMQGDKDVTDPKEVGTYTIKWINANEGSFTNTNYEVTKEEDTATLTIKEKSSGSGGGSYYPYTPSTPSTPAAPNLDKTKTDSTTALNAAATANKYDAAEQAEVKKILDKANADIKNAKTEAEVKAIEEAAQAEIDKILTTEEKAIVAALDNVEKRDFATKSKVITRKGGKKVIRLTWTAPDGVDVDGYEIFRSTKKNSGFGKKPYFTTSNTSYTNTKDLKTGKTYYYKVRAFVVINGERVYTDYSLKANRKL